MLSKAVGVKLCSELLTNGHNIGMEDTLKDSALSIELHTSTLILIYDVKLMKRSSSCQFNKTTFLYCFPMATRISYVTFLQIYLLCEVLVCDVMCPDLPFTGRMHPESACTNILG